ncbi:MULTISPECIES: cell division protein SepF [unclassified Staphylococcus]|uniref:cell division protein SepF n=1 Tax=unclassified Staphylococcus TaxID=91994 RepID=UPI0018809C5D|nr:cell division protein SepF [Staphylococcus sp. GDY8P57P]MBF2756779.1 cell division protein SepF [Staphylococcus haemolyticus]MBF2772834.1 cell division protein SepF [Staphylococcus haemolyticus]MBF2775550.1 cell division protein SepF [Staphylococcus haemolyticus]MBF2814851.1 cell division protein SepF [Staphylococcus haemolyticus]MBF9720112.1 cell division protein SepF [Staphylococcus haemolyticus]
MAIKDLFNNFFLMDDEEEVESPEERQRRVVQNEETETNHVQQNQPQQSERSYSNQSKLKSVPQKKASRNYNSEERNVRMNQPPSKSNSKNVVTMNQSSQSYSGNESSKMCLFEPRVFSDTQDIADELKNRRATLVNLQRIDKISAKRIIDFLSGTVYAIGGDIQRVGTDIFLCTPDNVEVAGSITDHIEQMETQHYE